MTEDEALGDLVAATRRRYAGARRFRPNPPPDVWAVRWTGDNLDKIHALVGEDAIGYARVDAGDGWHTKLSDSRLSVTTGRGRPGNYGIASPGKWVVLHEDGSIEVLTDAALQEAYRPVE